jgi:hypothetical protein
VLAAIVVVVTVVEPEERPREQVASAPGPTGAEPVCSEAA